MTTTSSRICLATVTTDSFVAGTLVMLHSFLKTNAWFDGGIVVIHDGLSEQNMDRISLLHDDVAFRTISSKLHDKVEDIVDVFPKLEDIKSRFYSLEIFNISGFEKYLFCDSDMLFTGSIEEITTIDAEFVACDARVNHFAPDYIKRMKAEASDGEFAPRSINAGVFVADKAVVGGEKFEALLDLICESTLENTIYTMADQIIINAAFAQSYVSVSGTYNYLLSREGYTHEGEEIKVQTAKVLHFVGPRNPWMPEQAIEQSIGSSRMLKANAMWLSAYTECLTALHLAHQMKP